MNSKIRHLEKREVELLSVVSAVHEFLSDMHHQPTDLTIEQSIKLRERTGRILEQKYCDRINSNPMPPAGERPPAPKAPTKPLR